MLPHSSPEGSERGLGKAKLPLARRIGREKKSKSEVWRSGGGSAGIQNSPEGGQGWLGSGRNLSP